MSQEETAASPRQVALGHAHGNVALEVLARDARAPLLCCVVALLFLGGAILPTAPFFPTPSPKPVLAACAALVLASAIPLLIHFVRASRDRRRDAALCLEIERAGRVETWHEALGFASAHGSEWDDIEVPHRHLDALAALADRLNTHVGAKQKSFSLAYLMAAAAPIAVSLLGTGDLGAVLDLVIFSARLTSAAVLLAVLALWLRISRQMTDLACIKASLSGGRYDLPAAAVSAIERRLSEIARDAAQQIPAGADTTKLV